jgi:hypothetical protein
MRLATRSTVIAAALTAMAIASPVAFARPAPDGPGTALAVTAIGAPTASGRLDLGTQQQSSGPHTQTVPVATPTLPRAKAALAAAIERAKLQALDNHVPPMGRTSNADTNAYATVTHPNPATPSGSGFDWSDAAIGAAIAAVIVLLITASTLAVRQRRQPRHP